MRLCAHIRILDDTGVTRYYSAAFRGSSAVEQWTVNPLVVGSNPTPGAIWDERTQNVRFSLYSWKLLT